MLTPKLALIATVLGFSTLAAQAQTATPRADKREAVQDKRIDKGVASGQLNAPEARRLEKQEASVDRTEARAKADGTVTPAERARIHSKQKKVSGNIAQQKHDAQTAR